MTMLLIVGVGLALVIALAVVIAMLSSGGKTARELELEQRVRVLEAKAAQGGDASQSWQQDAEVRALALAGDKIKAIKLVRERYKMGLKEAKECVDTITG